jgi:MFS transporter, OFA family, oxalate/formate antiporter
MRYTAKQTAAVLVPLGNVLTAATGGWSSVFLIASARNVVAAVMALVVLKLVRFAMY